MIALRRSVFAAIAVSAFVAAMVSCGGKKGSTSSSGAGAGSASATTGVGASPPTGDEACAAYGSAVCGRLQACSPFVVAIIWGDKEPCPDAVSAGCRADLGADGFAATPESIAACAAAIDALDCAGFTSGVLPDACGPAIHGTRDDGATCASGSQCKSGYCKPPTMPGCGSCAPLPKIGDTCTALSCAPGQYCSNMKCAAPLANGSACKSGVDVCAPGACIHGKCAAPLGEGSPCSPADLACDFGQGVECDPTAMTCQKIPVAQLGAKCGFDMMTGKLTLCDAGLTCTNNACANGGTTGDACMATMTADSCVLGAHCVGGTCSLATPACK